MKKTILLGIILTTSSLIVAGCSPKKSMTQNKNTVHQVDTLHTNYGEYSAQAVMDSQKAGKNVALFFHSKSCGSCKKLDEALTKDAADLPENLVVLKTDWDSHQELAKQYNVEKYHTLAFLDANGSKNVKGLFTIGDVIAARDLPGVDN